MTRNAQIRYFHGMPDDIASRVRAAIAYADLPLAEVAAALGVSQATVMRIKKGDREPKPSELSALAEKADVPLAYLTEGFASLSDPTDLEARVDYLESLLRDR